MRLEYRARQLSVFEIGTIAIGFYKAGAKKLTALTIRFRHIRMIK
jgi:hypothetical protein